MSHINEKTTLEERLSSIIFESKNGNIATKSALSVPNRVYEISIASKKCDTLYKAA